MISSRVVLQRGFKHGSVVVSEKCVASSMVLVIDLKFPLVPSIEVPETGRRIPWVTLWATTARLGRSVFFRGTP